jgi:hypothetical protein
LISADDFTDRRRAQSVSEIARRSGSLFTLAWLTTSPAWVVSCCEALISAGLKSSWLSRTRMGSCLLLDWVIVPISMGEWDLARRNMSRAGTGAALITGEMVVQTQLGSTCLLPWCLISGELCATQSQNSGAGLHLVRLILAAAALGP